MEDYSEDPNSLRLMGFRIEPEIFDPQLYTLYVDWERPILIGRMPILFTKPCLAQSALDISDCGASRFGPAPNELYFVYDITSTIYTIQVESTCDSGDHSLLVNMLLDFVNLANADMPKVFRRALSELADYITFNKDLNSYFESSRDSRQVVVDAIYWAIGSSLYNSRIVREK